MAKIAIVSDNKEISDAIQAKVMLLREDDYVLKYDLTETNKVTADIILIYTPEITDISLTTIKTLKKANNVIILIVENTEPQAILNAYDMGVNEFIKPDVTNFDLLIKLINAKKLLKQYKELENDKILLRNANILKHNADIYTNLENIIIPELFSEIFNSPMLNIIINDKDYDIEQAEKTLQRVLRKSDFIINYAINKYLIILSNTEFKNAHIVFEKLTQKLNLMVTGTLFKYEEEEAPELMKKIRTAEIKREEQQLTFFIYNGEKTETEADWLSNDLDSEKRKNIKLFQNIYNTKLEKVITPAYFRTKQKFERRFKNTKIKYLLTDRSAEFFLINLEQTNSFKIIYQNSALLKFQVQYQGLNAPENEEYTLPFSKINIKDLSQNLENFISKAGKLE